MGRKPKDITGVEFGFLTPLKPDVNQRRNMPTVWVCRCECGKKCKIGMHTLQRRKPWNNHCGCKGEITGGYAGWNPTTPVRRAKITVQKMQELRDKGLTLQAIADKAGVSRQRVCGLLAELKNGKVKRPYKDRSIVKGGKK